MLQTIFDFLKQSQSKFYFSVRNKPQQKFNLNPHGNYNFDFIQEDNMTAKRWFSRRLSNAERTLYEF